MDCESLSSLRLKESGGPKSAGGEGDQFLDLHFRIHVLHPIGSEFIPRQEPVMQRAIGEFHAPKNFRTRQAWKRTLEHGAHALGHRLKLLFQKRFHSGTRFRKAPAKQLGKSSSTSQIFSVGRNSRANERLEDVFQFWGLFAG